MIEPGEQGPRGKRADPGGGQLDREGQTVEAVADLGDIDGIVFGQDERRIGRRGPIEKEGHRRGGGDLVEPAPPAVGSRCDQGLHRHDVLGTDAEPAPAGGHDVQPGADREQVGETGRGRDEMLDVVQHQQEMQWGDRVGQTGGDRAAGFFAHAEGARHGWQDGRGIGDIAQVDEVGACGEAGRHVGGNLDRQAGLADSGRANQGHEADARLRQGRDQGGDFGFPADKGRRRRGQPARRPPQRGRGDAQVADHAAIVRTIARPAGAGCAW